MTPAVGRLRFACRCALLTALIALASAMRPVTEQPGHSAPNTPLASTGIEHSTMQELVEGAGFPLEEHFVETEDGYVLGVYRIKRPGSTGPPVLLQHGLLDSSAAWVLNSPSESLGFLLADAGYDVWLGNSRGNAFSRNHTGLDPATAAFWDFTFDDMARFDLPAMVCYILRTSNASQLAYVGHSQGTTIGFAALSLNTELRERISLAVMLAPAVYMAHIGSYPMLALAEMQADQLFNLLGVAEFMPSRRAASDLFGSMCKTTPLLCISVITAICGFDSRNVNVSRLPEYVQYAPSGTSVRNMAHWAQAVRKAQEREEAGQVPALQQYDYGNRCWTTQGLPRTCNMRVYGSLQPPAYNLSAIKNVPLAIFYGARDKLADQQDVETLLASLPSGAVVYHQLEATYEHIDFTWGVQAKDSIYPAVMLLLRQQQHLLRQQHAAR